MQFRLTDPNHDYVPSLKDRQIHLVGFAEVGMAFFRDFMVIAYGFSLEQAIAVCETINRADETGTIFPAGNLTGMPVRFFRSTMNERDMVEFTKCLRDAFNANRDHIRSTEMVFHFACGISNRDHIIDEVIHMAQMVVDDPYLKKITLVVDDPVPRSALQRTTLHSI